MMEILSWLFICCKWVILTVLLGVGVAGTYFDDIDFGISTVNMAFTIVGVMLVSYLFTYLFFGDERPLIKRGIRSVIFVFFIALLRFAERYFTIAAILVGLTLILFIALAAYLIHRRWEQDELGVLRCLKIAGKAAFNLGMVILIIPAFMGLVQDRQGAVDIEDLEPLSRKMLEQHMEQGYDLSMDSELLKALSFWPALDNETRIQTLIAMCEIEKQELGIKGKIPVKVAPLDEHTLGMYYDEEKTIIINVAHLDRNVKECIETVAHEVYHAHQFETMERLDFENEDVKTSHYYRKAREWKKNIEVGYIPALYSTENYKAQPIERDAREYAAARVEEYTNAAIVRCY
ncbi:MAG: hypothetical protein IKU84_07055 [Clostridia bacterium]|nr:hypothetical protein [Clostridia bacterium]